MEAQQRMASVEQAYRQIAEFAQAHGARRVVLFGSRARGTAQPKSDIDIAVEGCSDFGSFCDDVQNRLWSLLSVDIVNLDECGTPALIEGIRRDGRLLYEAI